MHYQHFQQCHVCISRTFYITTSVFFFYLKVCVFHRFFCSFCMTTSDNCTVQAATSLFLLLHSVITTHSRLTEQFYKAKQEQKLQILACKLGYQHSWKWIFKKPICWPLYICKILPIHQILCNWIQVYIHTVSVHKHIWTRFTQVSIT